jgi:hypothetical protein
MIKGHFFVPQMAAGAFPNVQSIHTSRSSLDGRRRVCLTRRLRLLFGWRHHRSNRLITATRRSDDLKHARESRTPPRKALDQQRPLLRTECTCGGARHAQRLRGLRKFSCQQPSADRYEGVNASS